MTLVPNETEQALNRQHATFVAAIDEFRQKITEQAQEIERLRAELLGQNAKQSEEINRLRAALVAELADHEEAIKHDRGGMEYASLVGIPLANADSLAQSVSYHERRAKMIRAALGGKDE